MTLWLSNLIAYSVQLAVLVATAAAALAVLRVDAPRAALRFWQVLFAAGLVWPAWQWWGNAGAPGPAAGPRPGESFPGDALWNGAAASVRAVRAGIADMDGGVATLAFVVIAAGAVLRLGWIGIGLIRLRLVRRASEPASALSAMALTLSRELGVAAEIRFSEDVGGPATIGAIHPAVLVPRRIIDLPPAAQRAALCHELMHVRRDDWLAAIVEEVWCAVLWFHPAARVLASRLSLARETLVDELTIAHTGDRRAYARALLEFSTDRPRLAGAAALIGRRHLERRIALIAQEVPMPRSSLVVRVAAAAAAVAFLTIAASSSVPVSATLLAQAGKVYKPKEDSSVTLPKVVREVKPKYTPAAMQARIEGTVWIAAVVETSGDVGETTVTRSLDQEHGLDQEALDTARQWKFEPGTRQGQPVRVEIMIEFTFMLK